MQATKKYAKEVYLFCVEHGIDDWPKFLKDCLLLQRCVNSAQKMSSELIQTPSDNGCLNVTGLLLGLVAQICTMENEEYAIRAIESLSAICQEAINANTSPSQQFELMIQVGKKSLEE